MKLVYGLTCLRANESCLAFAKRIVCGSIISLIIASTSFAQISVNWNDVHQQIDGFGASSAWTAPSLSDSQADLFFSTTSGVGLSLLRSRVAPDGTTTELVTMQKAQARGARVWSTPWSPPAAWKDNNDVNWGGHLLTNHYQDYANQLAAYVANAKAAGVNLYAISIQNEPDCWASYESCLWSARQFHDFVPYLYNALASYGVSATKILMPEQGSWTFALASTAMADANTVNMIGVVGAHSYGTTASAVNSYGKRLWMTEMCSSVTSYDGGIGDGLTWALSIHQYMTIAEANAWHYWWLIPNSSDNQALTDQYGNPAKRLYTLGNFSKFVRPGWYRVGTSDDGWVLISAYKNPNTSQFAIVCINVWGNNLTRTIALKGFSSTSVTPWLTSSSANLAQQSDVAILGSSFSYTFPAQSVVTFVGTSATAPTWSTNASSANWSAASSWSPSSVPASGSDVTFGSGGSTSVVNTTSRTVRNVLLERGTNFVIANSGGASLTISNGITVADSFSYAVSAPLVLGNSNTWFVNDSGTLQVSGAVSGGTPLTKAGNGMLTLSGGNTFTGNILVNGGTLQGASASVLNSVKTLTISAGTTLEITDSWQPASGTTVFNGNGTLQFDNGLANGIGSGRNVSMNMSSGGWLNIAGGQLWNGGWQNITWSANQSSLNIANGARFDMADGQSVYVDALTGSGTVDKNTAGSIVLNIGVNGGGGTFNGIIQNTLGAIELIKTGTGVQVLSGANSYSGATVINGGILRLDNPLALGGTSGIAVSNSTLVLNTAGVAITAPITINGNGGDNGYSYTSIAAPGGGTSYLGGLLTVGASGGRIWGTFSGGTTLIVTGGISGAGNQLLLYGESGTITLTNNPVVLGTLNAFGLNICVANNAVSNLIAEWGGGSAGINLNVANAFTNAPSLTIGNSNPSSFGLLNLNNYKLTVSSITNCVGSSDVITGGPSATLTVSNVSSQCYYNGSIKGVGLSLTKNGAGTLIIAGTNNTYTGATTINGGTLLIEGALNSGGGNVSVNSGGTLSGTGTVNRAIAINSGATLSPGDNNPGVLMIGSNCILNAGAILNYRLGFTNDQVIVTGNLTLGGTLNITDSGGFTTGTYTLFTYSGALTNNVLNIGATPDSSLVYQIDANTVDQVRLVVLTQFAAWQLQYFGCTNCPNAAPAADPYGKGMSNTNQFLAGLNPTNSASVFRVSKVAPNSSGFLVSWPSVPGKTYKVLYSDSPGGPWQEDLPSSQITADTGQTSLSYTDATIGSAVRRFYRIRLVTP